MANSLFRTKKIENILAEGSDDPHGGGGLKRVLSMRDLTFFGIAAILGAGSFSSLGWRCFSWWAGSSYIICHYRNCLCIYCILLF